MKKNCIVWCSELDDLNGQNIVTLETIKIIKKSYTLKMFNYKPGLNIFLIDYLFKLMFFYFYILLKKNKFIYLVCSRSIFGFLRDVPVLILSKLGIRLIIHVHGSDFLSLFENKFIGEIAKNLYGNCEIIVPSKHMLNILKKINFKKISLCENFVEKSVITYREENNLLLKSRNKKFKILWNSNIISSKGFFETYEAIKILNELSFDIQFIIIGKFISDSELSYKEIKKKYHDIQKKSWVLSLNQVSRKKYKKLILRSNLIILPSTYKSECQPLALIEAMIYGKHLIINDTVALRNTVGNYPVLITKRNKSFIAESIRECIANDKKTLQIRKKGALEARYRFSNERFTENFLKLL